MRHFLILISSGNKIVIIIFGERDFGKRHVELMRARERTHNDNLISHTFVYDTSFGRERAIDVDITAAALFPCDTYLIKFYFNLHWVCWEFSMKGFDES